MLTTCSSRPGTATKSESRLYRGTRATADMDEGRTESNDTVWDDGNDGIVYSTGWDSTPNSLADQYYMGTMQ